MPFGLKSHQLLEFILSCLEDITKKSSTVLKDTIFSYHGSFNSEAPSSNLCREHWEQLIFEKFTLLLLYPIHHILRGEGLQKANKLQ